MPSDAHIDAVDRLRNLGPLRVWSVLVTVFGDLAPDGALSGPTLSAIMAGIGIKPEASRVALHRLRSDGWIASQKNGRTSLHRLTEKGRQDSAAARHKIYAAPDQMGCGAQVVFIGENDSAPDPAHFVQMAPRVFIGATSASPPDGAMQLTPTLFPDWLGDHIESAALRDGYAMLHSALTRIYARLPEGTALSHMEIAVLRVLIVHAWRRLALKHPDLPRAAHSTDWRGHECRALVTQLLERFPRPDLIA